MSHAQRKGADPTKVINRLGTQLGQLYAELSVAMATIDDLEAENGELREQLAAQLPTRE